MKNLNSSELLKKENYFFENIVGDYSNLDDAQKTKLLVERVEFIVSAETSKYFTIHQSAQSSKKKKNLFRTKIKNKK